VCKTASFDCMGRGTASELVAAAAASPRRAIVLRRRPVLYKHRDNPLFVRERQVALDLDSTLFPLLPAMRALPGGENIDIHTCATWDTIIEQAGGLDAALDLFRRAMQYEHMARHTPYAGVLETAQTLREHGVKMHVMTRRNPELAEGTLRWLADHDIIPDTFVCDMTTNKVQRCKRLGISVIVDDEPKCLEQAHAVGLDAITLLWPYNAPIVRQLGVTGASDWLGVGNAVLDSVERRVLRTLMSGNAR
jgi:phosphoglycolate phosphatase-like HAD superfamily hydrolase